MKRKEREERMEGRKHRVSLVTGRSRNVGLFDASILYKERIFPFPHIASYFSPEAVDERVDGTVDEDQPVAQPPKDPEAYLSFLGLEVETKISSSSSGSSSSSSSSNSSSSSSSSSGGGGGQCLGAKLSRFHGNKGAWI